VDAFVLINPAENRKITPMAATIDIDLSDLFPELEAEETSTEGLAEWRQLAA
jgi:hypothetical protein